MRRGNVTIVKDLNSTATAPGNRASGSNSWRIRRKVVQSQKFMSGLGKPKGGFVTVPPVPLGSTTASSTVAKDGP